MGVRIPSAHMKTTVELSDALLDRLRERAAREKTTLRALISAAIQQFLRPAGGPTGRFRLKDGSVAGNGPAAGMHEGDWRTVQELSYEGRGGASGDRR